MFLYNLKVAYRNLVRQKSNSIINILGLSIGTACTILLFLLVHYSYTTDRFHNHYENIFLLQQKLSLESGAFTVDKAGGAVGPALAEAYPQIQSYTRVGALEEMLLGYYPEGKENSGLPISFIEKGGAAVDSTFFDVFSFEFIDGIPPKGNYQNNFIYLTETVANKLFNKEDPIGKTVYFQEGLALTVAGVLKDIQKNSTIQFSYLVPFEVEKMLGMPIDGYGGTLYFNYFVLDNPQSAKIINKSVNSYLDSKYEDQLEVDRYLSHIRDVFLYGENKASWGFIIFAITGLGILLVAAINYVNLSTAKSIDRAREVGIRKTGGAARWQLIFQFLSESSLITLISVNFSILLVEMGLPYFNALFDSDLTIPYQAPIFWIFIIALILIIGLLAGSYPAFMLSAFQPSLILKNFQGGAASGARLRKVLVVSQFSITLFFIVCTIFLYKQINFMQSADLGFDKQNIIYIPTRGKLWNNFEEIKGELLNESAIVGVTSASELPANVTQGDINWGKEIEKQNTLARVLSGSEGLIETFGLELTKGRYYSKDHPSDMENGIVVNEEIIKMLNYEGDPIGQKFRFWDQDKTIIGVVKDFTFFQLQIGAKALILPYRNINQFIFIKTTDSFNNENIARLEQIIRKHNPDYPFEYYTFEDYQNPTLGASDKLIPILFYFSTFGILISCLGMFGLALFMVEKRTKEIGIRKVFGASIPKITMLLSKGFIKLVLIANFIALPLAYLTLKWILKFFVLKIELSPSIFITTALSILMLAWATVIWQSLKVARKNPSNSLRYE